MILTIFTSVSALIWLFIIIQLTDFLIYRTIILEGIYLISATNLSCFWFTLLCLLGFLTQTSALVRLFTAWVWRPFFHCLDHQVSILDSPAIFRSACSIMIESLYTACFSTIASLCTRLHIKYWEIVINMNINETFLVLKAIGLALLGTSTALLWDMVDRLLLYIYNRGAYLALISVLKVLNRVIILSILVDLLILVFLQLFEVVQYLLYF
mgnify:CR=1 FL=1